MDPAQAHASIEALLDRNQPLPDPRALSLLYKEEALTERLPESLEAEAAAAQAPSAPGWSELPTPAPRPRATEDALPPPVWADDVPQPPVSAQPQQGTSQPVMSPSEIRAVMQKLQADFGGSYTLYEVPKTPSDDYGERTAQEERERELAELKRLADESARSSWVFLIGAAVVVVILGAFIYLAAAGPLRAPTPPGATPSASAGAAHH
jgi:hypothetical protein